MRASLCVQSADFSARLRVWRDLSMAVEVGQGRTSKGRSLPRADHLLHRTFGGCIRIEAWKRPFIQTLKSPCRLLS